MTRWRWFAFALALVPVVGLTQTATTNPEDEYKKLVRVDTEIQPLGDTPFGESVNVYDGSLAFHVTDISLPGNGPTIEIGRTFQADGDTTVRFNNASFGDWDLDLPRLACTLTTTMRTTGCRRSSRAVKPRMRFSMIRAVTRSVGTARRSPTILPTVY
ncbi:hypothetical protein [Kosakonia sp. S42]|uniref:hypothetical protein n=1 Tax=Kosakonia sp. S42 TaxID=2767458 RepID=UPI00190CC90A|nr:hypothetical protein [Kosakonia sp. S42]MBK0018752.1 hypothetical protein [Kosakonia sp. S42]